jgi:hypothetical protein
MDLAQTVLRELTQTKTLTESPHSPFTNAPLTRPVKHVMYDVGAHQWQFPVGGIH